jgi:hypothetical protein
VIVLLYLVFLVLFHRCTSLLKPWLLNIINFEALEKLRVSEEGIMPIVEVELVINCAQIHYLVVIEFHLFSMVLRASVFDIRKYRLSII